MIPIAKPCISEDEVQKVVDVIKSGMLAQGKVVEEFENEFAKYTGVKNSVAVSNGTSALDIALKAIGIKAGDEVITTPFTFVATSNSILFQGAKPVFADIEEDTYNIDPNEVLEKITHKTKAVIAVHLYGQPCNIKALLEICKDHSLWLIEDAAQAHGAEFNGKKVGSFGIGCFSFYATKNMTTGEGGMITTDDDEIAKKCRLLRSHGEDGKYNHVVLGYNMRMTNLQAALGLVQLKKLDYFNDIRRRNAYFYNRNITAKNLRKPVEKYGKHVYHQYVLYVEDSFSMTRNELLNHLNSKGIETAIHYPRPVYLQPLYRKLGFEKGLCPIAERVSERVVSIPVHPMLNEEDLTFIVDAINEVE